MEILNDSEIDNKITLDPVFKKQLVQYGIATGIFCFLFFVLLVSTVLSRKSWEKGLKYQLDSVYASYDSDYEVGEFEVIDNPFSVSCACYSLSKEHDDSKFHAVIIRIQTVFGPLPAVYTYKEGDDEADFVGFVSLNKRIETTVVNNARYSQIAYWGKRIPSIIAKEDL